MELRSRAMMGANAFLYIGPLLAGFGGGGWGLVLVFTAIFVLWTFVIKPGDAALKVRPVSGLLTQALLQTLIIAICFGVGRGIGGVLGSMPQIPTYLPIALSLLSIPFARIGQSVPQTITPWTPPNPMDRAPEITLAHKLIDALDQQSLSPEGDDLARHVEAITSQVDRKAILTALNARGALSPALDQARRLLLDQSTLG
jgi:hypothetical protein